MKLSLSTLFLLIFATSQLFAQFSKPNILLIQVDDMGYDDLSINGNTVSNTPHIDAFSKEAVRFSNFMLNSVCAPTRASLLTGRDFWRTGVSAMHGGRDYLNLDETTFAEIFQQNGYHTGMWGKWHSGKSDGYWPWDRGFDEAYYAQLYKYFPSTGWYNQYPERTTHEGKWTAEVLVDYAIDFIDRKKEEPFLAYVSFLTCHDFWAAPEKYISKYRTENRTERFATLLAMLEYMDLQVGRLLKHVDDSGLAENTIVIFLSDNGPNLGNTNPREWALRNNHAYLGNKARLWQNGLKSPLYIRHNGKYQAADVERLVTVCDLFPTLFDLANIKIPANNKTLDGRSIKSYLEGDYNTLEEKVAVFSHWFPVWEKNQFQPVAAEERKNFAFNEQRITMISEDYKLLWNPVNVKNSPTKIDSLVLIDVKKDKLEANNVAADNPEIVAKMKTELRSWFEDIKNTDGAFSAPEHQIAWKNKTKSEIRAFGPSRVTGALNDSHKVLEFNEIGEQLDYTINVHDDGLYELSVETKKSKLKGYEIEVSGSIDSFTKILTEEKNQIIGRIKLASGKSTLSVKISNKKPPANEGFGEFTAIQFRKCSSPIKLERQ